MTPGSSTDTAGTPPGGGLPAGVVLAGGRSRRFGRDKLAAILPDGRPMLAHAVDAVAAACGPVVVVLAPDAQAPAGMPSGVELVRDTEPFGGPVAGLLRGLDALRTFDALAAHDRLGLVDDRVVIVAGGDMPNLRPRVLAALGQALAGDPAAACARLGLDGDAATDSHGATDGH